MKASKFAPEHIVAVLHPARAAEVAPGPERALGHGVN